ncbi:MAG: FtsB family cell division protein [Candidatus Eiseniibacteriota bacterium]
MRDIGIRIQRYRLKRYRPAESLSERARLWLALGLAGWLIWSLFLSDHSAIRLLGLEGKKRATESKLATTRAEVTRNERDVEAADDPDVSARVLRERHNFAREGEMLYIIQGDGKVREAGAAVDDSTGKRAR